MIPVDYEEGRRLIQHSVCGDCGDELSLAWGGAYGIESHVVRCCANPKHTSIKSRETPTQIFRRQPPEDTQVPTLLRSHPMQTLKALIQARFPRADLTDASADVFILDCLRLDLDPLLGEIIPTTFLDRKTGRKIVTPLITENGYLSMAARGCAEEWMGPPTTRPVTDEALKVALLGPEGKDAFVWVATGKVKRGGQEVQTEAYGTFTSLEWQQARDKELPSATMPGNQARVRAINRWVRESFPEAKSRMKEMTAGWIQRAEGVAEAQQVIEAEYRELPPGQQRKLSPGQGQCQGDVRGASDAQLRHIAALAKERGIAQAEILRMAGVKQDLRELNLKAASEFIDRLKAEPPRQPELVVEEDKL